MTGDFTQLTEIKKLFELLKGFTYKMTIFKL